MTLSDFGRSENLFVLVRTAAVQAVQKIMIFLTEDGV